MGTAIVRYKFNVKQERFQTARFWCGMSKSDEYRANAAECQKMARLSKNPADKATWLGMAEDWLRMIPKPRQSAADKFDAAEQAQGTRQERSEAEH